jgi:bla regulator protein BlaR1
VNSLQWCEFMASYVFQASIVVGVVWGLERWTDASQLKTRIWSGCYVSLLLLFVAGLVLPRLQCFHPWSNLQPTELLLVANTENVLGQSLLAIWALGSSVMLARWIVQFFALHRFICSCPVAAAGQAERLTQLVPAKLLDIEGRGVEFRISPEELGPFCYQFHRPLVFLPQTLVDGDAAILRHVLHHELTHLRTQHPMQLFGQKMVQIILWFHPLVWISSKRASLVREFVCDDASSRDGGSTAMYLRTLVKIVEGRSKQQSGTLSMRQSGTLAIGRSKSELQVRARRLTAATTSSVLIAGRTAMLGLLLTTLACSQLWLPTNPLASSRSRWSPWPTWTATTLHAFDISVRDYERFDQATQLHDWIEDANES